MNTVSTFFDAALVKRAGIVVAFMGLGLPSAASAQNFEIRDLGTLGGSSSGAFAIDNNSTVVGWAETGNGHREPFVLRTGQAMDGLGTLQGGSDGAATAISSNGGFVVGYSGINEFGEQFQEARHGFLYDEVQLFSLGELYCPCDFNTRYGVSEAQAVNDHGQAVGHSQTVRGEWVTHAFLWEEGRMQSIGGGEGDWSISRAFDINNASQVVGDFALDAGALGSDALFDRRAFLWQDGTLEELDLLPAYTASSARAINDSAQIVGWMGGLAGESSQAAMWWNGAAQELGTLPGDESSQALGINNAGQVVGWSGSADQGSYRSFLWQDGEMIDLNALLPEGSAWELIEARDINDLGHIVGTGLKDGVLRAFILEPAASEPELRRSPGLGRENSVPPALETAPNGQARAATVREFFSATRNDG